MNVQPLYEEGEGHIVGYFCKGHVNRASFLEEIEVGWGDEMPKECDARWRFARWVPRPQWGHKARELVFTSKTGPGVFAVTYLEALLT